MAQGRQVREARVIGDQDFVPDFDSIWTVKAVPKKDPSLLGSFFLTAGQLELTLEKLG